MQDNIDRNHRLETTVYSGEEKTNRHKQLFGIVPGMGEGQICFCVALLLAEKGNT